MDSDFALRVTERGLNYHESSKLVTIGFQCAK